MRFYVASGLSNAKKAKEVITYLEERGFKCTYDWTVHGSVAKEGTVRLTEVSQREYVGVHSAEIVVVLLPGGRGTHFEMGVAIASGIRTYVVSEDGEHFQADENTCAFYHHPLVNKVTSLTALYFMLGVC